MNSIFKKAQSIFGNLKNESGQAATEYILILMVAVAIILGGVYQLNTAFKSFADSYFGDYLACLLETGELPSLDGGSSGECNSQYKPFSLAEGKPLVGSALSGDGEGGSSSDEDSGSTKKSTSNSASSRAGNTNIAQSGQFGGSRSGGGSNRFRASRADAGSAGADSENDGSNSTGPGSVTQIAGYDSGAVVRMQVRRAEGIRGGASEKEKEDKKKTKVDEKTIVAETKVGPQMIKVSRKVASDDKPREIEELSFGRLFRILIIAAIIIALLIFIGGQVLQVSKSMD